MNPNGSKLSQEKILWQNIINISARTIILTMEVVIKKRLRSGISKIDWTYMTSYARPVRICLETRMRRVLQFLVLNAWFMSAWEGLRTCFFMCYVMHDI